MTSLQLGGYDPLDARLDEAALIPQRQQIRSSSRFRLSGWSATSVPVASLLLVGIAIGPRGISLLSPGVLALLDPAIPVALAALGTLLGMSVDIRGRADRRLAGAFVSSALIAVMVAVPLALVPSTPLAATNLPIWMLAGAIGICAATSLAVPGSLPAEPRELRIRIREIGVLFPAIASGVLLGIIHSASARQALSFIGQAGAITLLVAVAAWLLLSRETSETEQRVFGLAAMLLVGGVADYLSLSALLCGIVAGAIWQFAGGRAHESLRRDSLYFQHSLLVLVLVVAGARTEFALGPAAVAGVYVLLRTAATLAGGWLAGRIARASEPWSIGVDLLTPGVFGVGLALNAVRAAGPGAEVLLTIVVLGTIGSEIVAELVRPRRPIESESALAEVRE
jgi:hypothetical protein